MGLTFALTAQERAVLAKLVHWSINSGLQGVDVSKHLLEDIRHEGLCVPRGCFVTLRIEGHLRGCIGTILPMEPLYKNIVHMAYAAAFSDPRFTPLTKAEWSNTQCEISVLGPITHCSDPSLIEVGRHGLLLQKGGKTGVFLPSVPVEAGWDLLQYLDNLCLKAGVYEGAWRQPDAHLCWFESFVFAA